MDFNRLFRNVFFKRKKQNATDNKLNTDENASEMDWLGRDCTGTRSLLDWWQENGLEDFPPTITQHQPATPKVPSSNTVIYLILSTKKNILIFAILVSYKRKRVFFFLFVYLFYFFTTWNYWKIVKTFAFRGFAMT